jgi:PERQ amino acid-rich with GYF domain-containing protein
MNGATQTFRRPSVATNLSHTRDSSQPMSASTPTSAAYIPPHLSSSYQPRNGSTADSRYSKEQLLSIFKTQRDSGSLGKNMGDHFLAAWNPLEDSSSTNGAWGKREDQKDPSSGPEVCWDHLGLHGPLALSDLTDEEREVSRLCFELPYVLLIVYTAVYKHRQFPTQAPAVKRFQGQCWAGYWAQVVHITC